VDFLLEPNIAYLVLLAGVLFGLMAIVTPGTGLLEIAAFFFLALAGYAVYYLSFNSWALIILVLSIFPFLYALQKPKREPFLALAIMLLVVGSVFLFASPRGMSAVNPLVALVASGALTGFLWIAIRKSLQAAHERPAHDLGGLIGEIGESRTKVHDDGSVQVGGELWSARSESAIPPGSPIRVVRRDGFVLVVEREKSANSE